ncbi:MAG TPA: phenylalanine--tRNA ligase subunit beta [Flavobacteriales bacterium]|nr:phenylalanine--tRNA ligase subunit beta [Flavobacteriales bacterium]
MRISWNWLRTLIDTDLPPHEAADILTSTGLEVESVDPIEPVKGMLAGVVVGQVVECTKHPDADRLRLCRVEVGTGDPLHIVCGAPNVATGQKVLVATIGTTLYPVSGDPLTIKKSKIRGAESHGMICAEDELGLGAGHAGILVLDPSARVGTPAAQQLGLSSDFALEIGLTPNRSDAMSHIGVARDLAAAITVRTGKKVSAKWPDVSAFVPGSGPGGIQVEVRSTAACPRYAGITLTNVKVAASPAWLQDRLRSIGLKPINNVVDVTNFVQYELGQPLHAFDADQLKDDRIVVRMAAEGESFTTLDGRERALSAQDLVIADAGQPACIAGVFGGLNSGVTDATTAIFLESACFDATTIRRTARRHGLNTDASFRFERGVDPEITVYALKRAALLLQDVAGATIASGITDQIARPAEWKQVHVRYSAANSLLGTRIDPQELRTVLEVLDCRTVASDADSITVEVPPYRVDVTRPTDLIEEVVRIIGFDRVPLPERLMMPSVVRDEVTFDGLQRQVAAHLAARGFHEVMTPSLVNGERTVRLNAATTASLVHLKNPLSTELDVMRPTLLFGLLQSAAHNIARQQKSLRLFESGRIYGIRNDGTTFEQERIALLITGADRLETWRQQTGPASAVDIAAEVEGLLTRLGLRTGPAELTEHPLLHTAAHFATKRNTLVHWGQVRPDVAKAFDLEQPAFYAELDLTACKEFLSGRSTTFVPVPRFPSVRRDLSLLLDSSVTFAQLERAARQSERKLLREVGLFDVYEGDKLPAGKKSYALSFILLDEEKTLTDDQVEKAMGRIRSALEKEAGAELRG